MRKGKVIAVAGKGGTGKTAIAALLIRSIIEASNDDVCILAVDADADSNLPDALGISYDKSVGDIREELLDAKQHDVTLDVRSKFEGKIAEIIEETDYFDLLVMGRPEGPGCYCPVNHILRLTIDTLAKNYDYVVIDCEAGLEHLSRRTTTDVDTMIVVLDTTLKSIKTALRLKKIADEIDVDVRRMFVIANKIPDGYEGTIKEEARGYGIEVDGIIPFDPQIVDYDTRGKPVMDLPDDSVSVTAMKRITSQIINAQAL